MGHFQNLHTFAIPEIKRKFKYKSVFKFNVDHVFH